MTTEPLLAGLTVVELAGIGPGPFCAMMLADHGAEVIRITRPGDQGPASRDPLHRSRPSLALDLKDAADLALLRRLIGGADVLLEGFRPGVLERLGLAPAALMADHPGLIVARMTGWGQDGPLSQRAGHDINYLATSGVLHMLGRAGGKPTPPINLVADFGGGGMLLAFGILAACLARARTGKGQIIDAAMVEGASVLAAMVWGFRGRGAWSDRRGENLLDTGAPFYDTYATADGKWIAVGAIERPFWNAFADGIGLGADDRAAQMTEAEWPRLRAVIAARIAERPRAAWEATFAGTDACVSPVLAFDEVLTDPHVRARGAMVAVDDVWQPGPAPRFSDHPAVAPHRADGAALRRRLERFGLSPGEAAALAQVQGSQTHDD